MLDNDVINQYDGLIFDMDGTVIDTMPSHAKAWEMVGQHYGYPFDGNLLYEMGGATGKKNCDRNDETLCHAFR